MQHLVEKKFYRVDMNVLYYAMEFLEIVRLTPSGKCLSYIHTNWEDKIWQVKNANTMALVNKCHNIEIGLCKPFRLVM